MELSKSSGKVKKMSIQQKLSKKYVDDSQKRYEDDRAKRAREHPEWAPRPKIDIKKTRNFTHNPSRGKEEYGVYRALNNNSLDIMLDSEIDGWWKVGSHPNAPRKKNPHANILPRIDKIEESNPAKTPMDTGYIRDAIKYDADAIKGLGSPNRNRDNAQRAESQAIEANRHYETLQSDSEPKPPKGNANKRKAKKENPGPSESGYNWKTWKWGK